MRAKILVVDDEPDVEALVSQRFRREIRREELGFVFAQDGEDALAAIHEHADIDIVLSDINMPRMDGLTLLRHLQSFDQQLRAVLVSAYGDMHNIRRAMNLGAFDFVTKPIEFDDLEHTINRALEDLEKLREMTRQREHAEQAKASLSRYFSPNLVAQLAQHSNSISLAGQRRHLSFVFTDLAGFTTLVESLEPELIVPLLNEYLEQMTGIVFKHGGTMDKVVGDAVHAMFGAPVDQSNHAELAVRCALEMDEFAQQFRVRVAGDGIELGVTRIGVHSGTAIVGNFGGDSYFDYTAHGDAVNTAARLEAANKIFGTRICISDDVRRDMTNFRGRPIGSVTLAGKTEPLQLFEPLTDEQHQAALTADYLAAYEKLEREDPAASQAFAACVGAHGEDPLATFHLKRLLAGEVGPTIVLASK